MKTVVLAYHSMGCIGIEELLNNDFEIAAIFTHKDDSNENLWFDSVEKFAKKKKIPVFSPENINEEIWIKKIQEINPEIIFSFYYRNIICKDILDIPTNGCINLHGSLLPKYRGRAPINWAIINGETETGVTLHYMTTKPDDGDIINQIGIKIEYDDTAKSLFDKALTAANILLKTTLPEIKKGTSERTPQDNIIASYYHGRTPEDGLIDWNKSSTEIRNLVRGVTSPYPGAFSFLNGEKIYFWEVEELKDKHKKKNGEIISTNPLVIACENSSIKTSIESNIELKIGMQFENYATPLKKVFILGVNGFIGYSIAKKLLDRGEYEVFGIDIFDFNIEEILPHPNFHFVKNDIRKCTEWVETTIKNCDIILPLIAIANPKVYIENPLKIYELDYEENIKIIKLCHKYKKRLIFPSTSEVYGMCKDELFSEETSKFITGSTSNQRWIYSTCKQLLDRVIFAYGKQGLKYTIFRPFNWVGPRLDTIDQAKNNSSRVITQFICNLLENKPIILVDGGEQKRCFLDINDGIECLYSIIKNDNNLCENKIINIGNPENECKIKDLAKMIIDEYKKHPLVAQNIKQEEFLTLSGKEYYGEGYEDCTHRKPDISNAKKYCNWSPSTSLKTTITDSLNYLIQESNKIKDL